MDKKSFGFACLTGAALFAYFVNQRGYFSIPEEQVNSVPEKKAKAICLSYDERLKHNLDSLMNSGLSTSQAIKDAHTITWEEASARMPKKVKNYSAENLVELKEAQEQVEKSRTVTFGKATIITYRDKYPGELGEEIEQRKRDLQELNNSNSGQKVSFRVSQNDGR